MYDTLKSMDCLAEMNVDNLERMISRLPKWMQSKFAEHLRKIEHGGRVMPTFKDVVNFLKERASVANHPFFSNSLMGNKERVPNSGGRQRIKGKLFLIPMPMKLHHVQCALNHIHCTDVMYLNPKRRKSEENS